MFRAHDKLLREDKTEKVDWTYITDLHDAFERVIKRFQLGEKKYSRLNFRNCEDYKTYEESALRHLIQFLNGKTDEDHLAACIVNLLIIMDGANLKDEVDAYWDFMDGKSEWGEIRKSQEDKPYISKHTTCREWIGDWYK